MHTELHIEIMNTSIPETDSNYKPNDQLNVLPKVGVVYGEGHMHASLDLASDLALQQIIERLFLVDSRI